MLIKVAENVASNFNRKYLIRQNLSADSENMDNILQERDFTQEIVEEAAYKDYISSNIAGQFLNTLSESEKQLYELKFIQKKSNDEIGKIFKITPNAVSSRSKRLIDKFKKEFLTIKK